MSSQLLTRKHWKRRHRMNIHNTLLSFKKKLKKQSISVSNNVLKLNQTIYNLVDGNEKLESRLKVADSVLQLLQKSYSDCNKRIIDKKKHYKAE